MDINISDKLVVEYKLILFRQPIYSFYINNIKINNVEGKIYFNLNEELIFKINLTNLNSAIEFESLKINDKEVLKKYLHLANPPTHWIENFLTWEFRIPKHFYAWYQEITGHGEIF